MYLTAIQEEKVLVGTFVNSIKLCLDAAITEFLWSLSQIWQGYVQLQVIARGIYIFSWKFG